MPAVVAAVVRGRRAFSGVAATRVIGDVGCGCHGPPQLFSCHAVMIAHARETVLAWWGPARQRQMQPPAINAHDARFSRSVAPPDL
jgi:hypothetical protein